MRLRVHVAVFGFAILGGAGCSSLPIHHKTREET